MELPNYSRQLMQQLRTLRREGQFCDCTILVGDNPHNAHKLVLAASSMLFRSLLDGSDSISIDTAVVSSQVFSSLLDMVYSGKLPPGKHNLTHIIAAADSLQMFDVARGCRNILSDLMNHSAASNVAQPASATANIRANDNSKAEETDCLQKTAHIPGRGDVKTACVPGRGGVKTAPPRAHMKNGVESAGQSGEVGGSRGESASEEVEQKETEEPPCKKPCLQVLESSEHPFKQENTQPPAEDSRAAGLSAEDRLGSSSVLLVHSSELLELLTGVPSIADLLTQAAHGSVGEPEKQTVLECCKEADPVSVVGGLLSSVRQGTLSEEALLTVLRVVQERAPSPSQRLFALLEGIQTHGPQEATLLEDRGSEAEKQGDRPQSGATVAPKTNEEEDKCTSEDEEGGEEDNQEEEQEEMGRGKRKPKPRPRESPTRTQPYHCRWCQKGFTYKCRMQAHAKRCSLSRESQHQCPLCPELLPTPQALQKHRAQAHPDTGRAKKKVACELCGRAFAHLSGMLYHKRTEHFEEKPFACEECGAKFAANSSLKNHMRLHTGEKPYHCKHCDMSFSVAAALAYHTKKKHSEGKMYACQYCEALFAQSIELTRHVRTHTGDKPYVCRECGKGFSQANGLSVHLQTFHNISEPHDCQKCRLSFSSLEENRQHIQQCHPKEFHKCPACEKLFSSAALLEKHKTTHTGSKPYSCKLCHKSYQQLSGLWYHNRTNHPEVFAGQTHKQLKTLIQCDICLKFFPSANSLAKHQKAEHPEADGLVIGNADLSSDSSAVHCPYCPALFPSEEEMQEHASSQHFSQEDSAFGCSLCPLVCPSQLQLQEHFLSCHAGALEEQEECVEDPASAHAVIKMEDPDGVEAEHVITLDQSQLGGSQQVFVALGDGADGQSPSEVVAVNVDDLLNGTVTFICGDGQ